MSEQKDKSILRQDSEFMYFADGSKETIDAYRKRHGKISLEKLKQKEFDDYNKDPKNKAWHDAKVKGEIK